MARKADLQARTCDAILLLWNQINFLQHHNGNWRLGRRSICSLKRASKDIAHKHNFFPIMCTIQTVFFPYPHLAGRNSEAFLSAFEPAIIFELGLQNNQHPVLGDFKETKTESFVISHSWPLMMSQKQDRQLFRYGSKQLPATCGNKKQESW